MENRVIIIGGGIIGISIGYFLAKNNCEVLILEKSKAGREASWSAAGMLRPQAEFEDAALLRLCLESIKSYPEFAKQLFDDTGVNINYKTEGTIIIAITDEQLRELHKRFEEQKILGLRAEWLSNKELLELEPNAFRYVKGSVLIKGDHWANNRLIVEALIKGVRKYKCVIMEDCLVESYIHEKNRIVGVKTSVGSFSGKYIINSAGSWASHIKSDDAKLIPPIKPILGQLVEISTPDMLITHNICTYSSYLASKDKNSIVIGSTMEDVGFNKTVTVSGVSQLLKNAVELVPKISDCVFKDVWAGFRPTAPDKLPVLGRTSAEGLLMATGTYRNGILLAPIVGKLISEIIVRDSESELIEPFKIERFYR